MNDRFTPGDFLFFQLEAGFALVRILAIEEIAGDTVWHLAAFNDLFADIDSIENTVMDPTTLSVSIPHIALTNRAFESTQVSAIGNSPPTELEMAKIIEWRRGSAIVSDMSIRLHIGLR